MTLRSVAKFKEKLTLCSKSDMRNLANFHASSGKSKNLHFDDYFCRKYIMSEPKKYIGVTCHNTEE